MRGRYKSEDFGDKRRCSFCGEIKAIEEFPHNGPDAYRTDCKKCYNARRKESKTLKRHTAFVAGMKRRGESTVAYTHQQWKEAVIFFGGECAYCGRTPRKGERLTRDHLEAVCNGGQTTQENIVPACSHCNASKNKSEWREWFMKQPFFSQERMNKIFRWRSIICAAGGGETDED